MYFLQRRSLISYFAEEMYFLAERTVAQSEVMSDFTDRYKADKTQANEEGCRLSFPRKCEFGSLPYGLTLQKNNTGLKKEVDEM